MRPSPLGSRFLVRYGVIVSLLVLLAPACADDKQITNPMVCQTRIAFTSQRGGSRQGMNDFRQPGDRSPCRPLGKPHRYFFKRCALYAAPVLRGRGFKNSLESAIAGHVLAEGRLMGTYGR
jgi:phosphatidylethanolamine-binding protein (PEBP) family uncharacterized protein